MSDFQIHYKCMKVCLHLEYKSYAISSELLQSMTHITIYNIVISTIVII